MTTKFVRPKHTLLLLALLLLVPALSLAQTTTDSKDQITSDSFLYTFDILAEKVDLFFTSDESDKAEKLIEYANERLEEAEILAQEGDIQEAEEAQDKAAEYALEAEKVLATDSPEEAKENESLILSIAQVQSESAIPAKNLNATRYYNTEQTGYASCADIGQGDRTNVSRTAVNGRNFATVPADSFYSTVSQAAADATALRQAETIARGYLDCKYVVASCRAPDIELTAGPTGIGGCQSNEVEMEKAPVTLTCGEYSGSEPFESAISYNDALNQCVAAGTAECRNTNAQAIRDYRVPNCVAVPSCASPFSAPFSTAPIPVGSSVTAYAGAASYTCNDYNANFIETRTCINSARTAYPAEQPNVSLSGSLTIPVCYAWPLCTNPVDGSTMDGGDRAVYYEAAHVPHGSQCRSEILHCRQTAPESPNYSPPVARIISHDGQPINGWREPTCVVDPPPQPPACSATGPGGLVTPSGSPCPTPTVTPTVTPTPTVPPVVTPTPEVPPPVTPTETPTPTPSSYSTPTPTPTPLGTPTASISRQSMTAAFYEAAKKFCRENKEFYAIPLCVAVR